MQEISLIRTASFWQKVPLCRQCKSTGASIHTQIKYVYIQTQLNGRPYQVHTQITYAERGKINILCMYALTFPQSERLLALKEAQHVTAHNYTRHNYVDNASPIQPCRFLCVVVQSKIWKPGTLHILIIAVDHNMCIFILQCCRYVHAPIYNTQTL